ncbi:MAG: DUF6600 domain-containing protein [Vicinamibacteria bacterium]
MQQQLQISNARRIISALALSVTVSAQAGAAFQTQDEPNIQFRDGRFLETQGGVTIQRADEVSADEAVRNMPFLQGDRVWTDNAARAEIIFADGEVLWIAERSKIDSLGRGGREQDERLGLRLFSGSFGARVRSGGPGFLVQATGGTITTTGASAFRVDARTGETTVSVSEGEILADLGGKRMTLRAGERVRYADGGVDGPFRYPRANLDGFDRWCEERSRELSRMAARTNDRLPEELATYGDELDRNGEWVYDEPQGYVYVPRVAADWSPYAYGRWVYTLYGWTWVADEPWGFVTSHYGRWGYSSRVGWHWMPRLGFSGAWVSWSTPVGNRWSNTIGWCALAFNDRPISSFSSSSGRAALRGDVSGRGWSFANRSDLGRGSIHARRIAVPGDEAARAVVWNGSSAPDREFRETRRVSSDSRGVARSGGGGRETGGGHDGTARILVRPSPGDSQPELRSDPTTTIPTPESRRGPAMGQDGFKDEQDRRNRGRRDNSTPAVSAGVSSSSEASRDRPVDRGTGSRSAPSADSGSRATDGGAARDPLLNRFFRSITRPNAEGESARSGDGSRSGDGNRNDDSSVRRRDPAPRQPQSGDSGGASPRTRDDSSARQDGGSQPRPSSGSEGSRGGSSRPSGGEQARPSGGERSRPRTSPPPESSPSGGSSSSSDDRGSRRRQN